MTSTQHGTRLHEGAEMAAASIPDHCDQTADDDTVGYYVPGISSDYSWGRRGLWWWTASPAPAPVAPVPSGGAGGSIDNRAFNAHRDWLFSLWWGRGR